MDTQKKHKSHFFLPKEKGKGKRVLTIAATFPSLIQPWLVNQLVEIIHNGGENRILARRSEQGVYGSKIDEHHLLDSYAIADESNGKLVANFFKLLFGKDSFISTIRGLFRYRRVALSSEFTLKEKAYAFLLTPYMGLRDVDVIHSHSEPAGNKFLPIVVALDKPFVFTFHGLPPVGVAPISDAQRKRYVAKAQTIFVNTEFAKKQYVSLGGDSNKIKILPQGTNLESYPFKARPYPADNHFYILTVGRYHPDKGQKYAIEAVEKLILKGHNITYLLVGNGPEKENLQSFAKQLGVANQVEFHSSLSDEELRQMYDQAHIFILPSLKSQDGFHEETQGVVLQEAQASGLIVIATATGGIPECIDDGNSGFLVPDRSAEAIADRLEALLDVPERWPEIQQAGRDWVSNRYDIKYIGALLDKEYDKVVKNAG